MMNNIVTDMKAAVNLFKDMRKARREGTGVVIKQCRELPFVKSGPGFYDTPEGCNLNHCGRRIDKAAQKALLTAKELRAAMMRLLHLYIHCKRLEMETSDREMIGGRA